MVDNTDERVDEKPENADQSVQSGGVGASPEKTERTQPGEVTETVYRKNPPRAKRRPAHLQDYDTGDTEDNLNTWTFVTGQCAMCLILTRTPLRQPKQGSGKLL